MEENQTTNGAFIVDSLGKLLVAHPTGHDLNLWSVPKGLYDDGETISRVAAERETWEETDMSLELFENNMFYCDLGINQYKTKKKQIHAHLFYIKLPLSTMNLNFTCKSNFISANTGRELPENDETKWVDFDFAENFLHESQQPFLKIILKKLATKLKK